MSEYKPHAVIIAGPNGSGKTSLIDDLIAFGYQKRPPLTLPSHIINPDKIRQSPEILALKATSQNLDLAAQKLAYQRRQRLIEARQSLAFETVMSHPSRLVELQQLRNQGYRVFLMFITTNNADINVDRVRYRVQTGTTTGHDVPELSIRERHVRTLNLLPAAIELAYVSLLYDNSYKGQTDKLQAHIESDSLDAGGNYRIEMTSSPELWVSAVLARLQERNEQRNSLIEKGSRLGAEVVRANPLDGHYAGIVVDCGADYFGLLDRSGERPVLSVHDRLMFVPNQQPHLDALLKDGADHHAAVVTYRPYKEPELNKHDPLTLMVNKGPMK